MTWKTLSSISFWWIISSSGGKAFQEFIFSVTSMRDWKAIFQKRRWSKISSMEMPRSVQSWWITYWGAATLSNFKSRVRSPYSETLSPWYHCKPYCIKQIYETDCCWQVTSNTIYRGSREVLVGGSRDNKTAGFGDTTRVTGSLKLLSDSVQLFIKAHHTCKLCLFFCWGDYYVCQLAKMQWNWF